MMNTKMTVAEVFAHIRSNPADTLEDKMHQTELYCSALEDTGLEMESRAINAEAERDALAVENQRLRGALAFYADRRNYDGSRRHEGYVLIDCDGGKIARAALESEAAHE